MIKKVAGVVSLLLVSPAHADLSALQWMAGCWAQNGNDPGSLEQWMAPSGGLMLGMNRSIRDGKAVGFEYLRIIEKEDNTVELVASPSGQESARFNMVSVSENEVVFENPDHDFPTRIIYRLVSDGSLLGRIEGIDNGTPRTADFPMTRTECNSGG